MYAEIVVLTYQGPDVGYFTYKIPENLKDKIKPGQIVEIPFGKRNPLGVITNTRSHLVPRRDLVIKPINSIVTETPLLLPYQLKLLYWMSKYYLAPTVNCLEAILPFNEKMLQKFLITEAHPRGVFGYTSRLHPGGDRLPAQTLVLVPFINRIPETLPKHKSKEYLVFHNQLKSKEKFDIWTNLLSKNVETVFGSRSAIFLPFQNLKEIIIYDEHEIAYKDERSPYYDSLTILDVISRFTGAKLQIIDSAPKVTTHFQMKDLIKFETKKPGQKTRIVSMQDEKKSGNWSPISQLLQKLIIQNYKLKGSTLLFLNKKNESGSFYCKSCQTHLFLEKTPKQCPQCNSFDFYYHSLNIESLKKEILKFLPNAQINLLSDSVQRSAFSVQHSIDIDTSAIFYSLNLTRYDLIAHISVDHILNLPEYSSAEKTYQQISGLKKLAKDKGILILQTHNPENLVIRQSASDNYQAFFQNEIKERRLLQYPPFSLLIKLVIKGKTQEKIILKAAELTEKLTAENIKITGPFASIFRKKTPSYNIILRNPVNSYSTKDREEVIKKLGPGLKTLSGELQIIVEPENLN